MWQLQKPRVLKVVPKFDAYGGQKWRLLKSTFNAENLVHIQATTPLPNLHLSPHHPMPGKMCQAKQNGGEDKCCKLHQNYTELHQIRNHNGIVNTTASG